MSSVSTFTTSIRNSKLLPFRVGDTIVYLSGKADAKLFILDKSTGTTVCVTAELYLSHLKAAGLGKLDPIAYVDLLRATLSAGKFVMTASAFRIYYEIEAGFVMAGSYPTVNIGLALAEAIAAGVESVIEMKASAEAEIEANLRELHTKEEEVTKAAETASLSDADKALIDALKDKKPIKTRASILNPLVKRRKVGGGIKIN